MDYYGGFYAALGASCFCVVGSVIAACASNSGRYGLLVAGRIIMGFGSIMLVQLCRG